MHFLVFSFVCQQSLPFYYSIVLVNNGEWHELQPSGTVTKPNSSEVHDLNEISLCVLNYTLGGQTGKVFSSPRPTADRNANAPPAWRLKGLQTIICTSISPAFRFQGCICTLNLETTNITVWSIFHSVSQVSYLLNKRRGRCKTYCFAFS